MRMILKLVGAMVLLFGLPSAALAAQIFVCGSGGQAYIITEGNPPSVAPAGGCAGGPYTFELFVVPVGDPREESDWRNDRNLSQAYAALRRLPNRGLTWSRATGALRASAENLRRNGQLVVRADRLPRNLVRSLRIGR
jgi:hypothetical protein